MRKLDAKADQFRLRKPFTISRGSVTALDVVTASVSENGVTGWGECRPYARYSETVESVLAQIKSCEAMIEAGCDRTNLQEMLEPGAAKNALDCALWDLQAKLAGQPAWALAGLKKPIPQSVTYTISLDTPEAMGAESASVNRSLLKLKLGGQGDMDRMRAVRRMAPKSRLIVDANEGWSIDFLVQNSAEMHELGIELIEQPLPANDDAGLNAYQGTVSLCADESCHSINGIGELSHAYRFVNIKLDKTGGLTGAMALADEAERRGLGIMLGCMMASSLAMAPAFLLADRAKYVDLDAPLLLNDDREHAFEFDGELMMPPSPNLWG